MKIVADSKLNGEAAKIKGYIDQISNDIRKIEIIIECIPAGWQGTDATSFINKYKESVSKLKQYVSSLNDYYTYMSKVYDIFNTLDDVYSKSIDTN